MASTWSTRRSCSGAAAPRSVGAGAAFLGRSGQALFSTGETRIQVSVDDPVHSMERNACGRSWNKVILLLWLLVVGPAISWKKLQTGRQAKWVGVLVQLEEKAVVITLPDKFIAELLEDDEQLLLAAAVPTGRLRKSADRAEWAASVVPYLWAMISPVWKALGDAQRGTVGRRIEHSLRWLRASLLRRKGHCRGAFTQTMGMQPQISSWSSTRHPGDWGAYCTSRANRRDGPQTLYTSWMSRGSRSRLARPRTRPCAMLVGVRLWARFCYTRKWAVYLRSDSQAALGATFKLRSPDPRINAVVREISLDLADGKYEIDFLELLPGANNVYVDSRSRFYQPGASRKIPEELASVERDVPPKRSQEWWETAEACVRARAARTPAVPSLTACLSCDRFGVKLRHPHFSMLSGLHQCSCSDPLGVTWPSARQTFVDAGPSRPSVWKATAQARRKPFCKGLPNHRAKATHRTRTRLCWRTRSSGVLIRLAPTGKHSCLKLETRRSTCKKPRVYPRTDSTHMSQNTDTRSQWSS